MEIDAVHSIPCTVVVPEGTAQANVRNYFEPLVRPLETQIKTDQEFFTASFRGRPLAGININLPEGYKGVTVKESDGTIPLNDQAVMILDGSKSWHVNGQFSSFKYWTLDTPPTPDDKMTTAVQWISLSQSIHQPISPDLNNTETET